ncbi:MAG TPA: PilZ domain-containing protein [Gammaproteobacteria bacterium]|nr:PilZ domain-containing protein [Gammaproteobacteria bacterium]
MDRRWSARKQLPLSITLEVPRHGTPVTGNLRDLSLSGAFVKTDFLLPLSPLVVAFTLPGDPRQEELRLEARVVRRSAAGSALMFLCTPTRAIRALSEALSQCH